MKPTKRTEQNAPRTSHRANPANAKGRPVMDVKSICRFIRRKSTALINANAVVSGFLPMPLHAPTRAAMNWMSPHRPRTHRVYPSSTPNTFITNANAAAAIGTPIAIGIATELGVSPEPFVLAVLFGALVWLRPRATANATFA